MSLAKRKIMPRRRAGTSRRSAAGRTAPSRSDAVRVGEPIDEKDLAARLPEDIDLQARSNSCSEEYASRGVNLVRVDGKWTFRTATDLSWLLTKETTERASSRAPRSRRWRSSPTTSR